MTEDQTYLFEELLKEARIEYPDSLDYNLQVLCYKLAVDGTLDTDISPEEVEDIQNKYKNQDNIHYTV